MEYGFVFSKLVVFWVARGEMKVDELLMFWLNKFKVKFQPPHSATFLFNAAATVHCTTVEKESGIIEMAFLQKTHYIIQLKSILTNPTSKRDAAFLKAKVKYEVKKVCILN